MYPPSPDRQGDMASAAEDARRRARPASWAMNRTGARDWATAGPVAKLTSLMHLAGSSPV